MPAAARVSDSTGHGNPLAPGPGSPDVKIGGMAAWRALPSAVGAAVEGPVNAMKSFMDSPTLQPPGATPQLVQIQSQMAAAAGQAAAAGNPAAAGATATAFGTLTTANVGLTTAYTSAAAVPGGEPAATTAYTQGIKAAAATAMSAAMSAIAGMTDMHNCAIPVPPMPHGPGVVTKASQSVFINNLPACRQGDQVFEACGGPDPIAAGCPQVLIDEPGGGGGGSGGGGSGGDGPAPDTPGDQPAPPPNNAPPMTPAELAAIAIAVANLIAAGLGQGLTEVCNMVTGTPGGGGDAPTGVVSV